MTHRLAFLLILITLAGTFVPCCLFDECAAEQGTSSTHNANDEQQGSCSPFFVCASCPAFAVVSKPIELDKPAEEKITHVQGMMVYHLTHYSASFWQPPRSC